MRDQLHNFAALIVLALFSPAKLQAEPSPTLRPAPQVPPLSYSVGDGWCYRNHQVLSGDLNRTWVETVTAVNETDVQVERIDRVSGVDQPPTSKTWTLEERLRRNNLRVVETWTEPTRGGDEVVGQSEYKVLGTEVLDSAVGEFETFRVETRFTRGPKQYRQVFWYAPRIGNLLKLIYLDKHGRPTQATEITCFNPAVRKPAGSETR